MTALTARSLGRWLCALLLVGLSSRTAVAETDTSRNPIFLLLTTPRTGSTAFLRLMDETGIFHSFNEPFMLPWASTSVPERSAQVFGRKGASYDDVWARLNEAAQTKPVFVKEMMFTVRDYLLAHPEIVRNPAVRFLFLVRDPYSSLKSYAQIARVGPFERKHAFNFRQMFELFRHVDDRSPNRATLVEIEPFTAEVRTRAPALFRALGLPGDRLIYEFPERTAEEVAKRFNDPKVPEQFTIWHEGASTNNRIAPIRAASVVDDGGRPEDPFAWVEDERMKRAMTSIAREGARYVPLLRTHPREDRAQRPPGETHDASGAGHARARRPSRLER